MKKYRFEIILFIENAISMILELVASRVLAPYFGTSNLVWTSIIGIILLSSSIGNYYGGKIADKEGVEDNLKYILVFSSVFILLIPLLQNKIIEGVVSIISSVKIGAILTTIFLFFIPSVFMGLLTPIILKLKLDKIDDVGKISGKIYAIATIGGISGTFLGGFYLVPNFGSVYILFILALIVVLLALLVDFKFEKSLYLNVSIIAVISIVFMILFTTENNINADKILSNKVGEKVSFDTEYGRVIIYNSYNSYNKEEIVRVLNIDSGFESATYLDEDKINELVFPYTTFYDLMFDTNKNIENVLMIGGAGYSYPKYFISHYLDKKMDVVEIDGRITEIAKKYFFLDKLIKDYDLEKDKRLNLINDDGRTYLNRNNKKYDAILNDAFSGDTPAKVLTTIEANELIKNSLTENGLYLTNIITSLEGEKSKFLNAEVNTLKQVFKNVYIVRCNPEVDKNKSQNIMVISTNQDVNFENSIDFKNDNKIVLTDDYCPIDTLVPQ